MREPAVNTAQPRQDIRTSSPLSAWLGRHANRVFVDGSHDAATEASVTTREIERRPSAHLHRVTMTQGQRSAAVMIKARPAALVDRFPTPPGHWALFTGPSWVPAPPFERRSELEFDALHAIDEHFRGLDDSRFTTVRPISLEPSRSAFAMAELEGMPLDRLLAVAGSIGVSDDDDSVSTTLLESAGAWLAQYHELPLAPIHHQTREELIDALRLTASELPRGFTPARPIRELCERTIGFIESQLPEVLPTGLTHGDFWSGNVLVDAVGRVAVIDTFAASRTPIFEDLAYFIFQLKTPNLRGPARISARTLAREQRFLEGYFAGAEIPLATLRIFELCVLIRKWAGRCHRCFQQSGAKQIWKRVRLQRQARSLTDIAAWLIDSLREQASAEAASAASPPGKPSSAARARHGE